MPNSTVIKGVNKKFQQLCARVQKVFIKFCMKKSIHN